MELVSAPIQLFRCLQKNGQTLFTDKPPGIGETEWSRGGGRLHGRMGSGSCVQNPVIDDFGAGQPNPALDVIRDWYVVSPAAHPSARKCKKKNFKTLYGPLRSPIALPTLSIAPRLEMARTNRLRRFDEKQTVGADSLIAVVLDDHRPSKNQRKEQGKQRGTGQMDQVGGSQ